VAAADGCTRGVAAHTSSLQAQNRGIREDADLRAGAILALASPTPSGQGAAGGAGAGAGGGSQ
jgi:hypothetical protein